MSQAPQQSPWQAQSAALQMQQLGMMSEQMSLISAMNGLLVTLNQGFNNLTRAIIENTRMMAKITLGPNAAKYSMMAPLAAAGKIPWQGVGKVPSQATMDMMNIIDTIMNKMSQDLSIVGQQFGVIGKASGTGGGTSSQGAFSKHGSLLANPVELWKNMFLPLRGIFGEGGAMGGFLKQTPVAWTQGIQGPQQAGAATKSSVNLGGLVKGAGQLAKNIAGPMLGAFASMGPQMAMMAIVMAPVQALLEGLFEPFEAITDIFGAYGSILGQMFLPLIQMLVPILVSFLPVLQSITPFLGEMVLVLFKFTTPIGLLIEGVTWLIDLFGANGNGLFEEFQKVGGAIQPFTNSLSIVGTIITAIGNIKMPDFSAIASSIATFVTVTVPGFFIDMINRVVAVFMGIGTTFVEILADVWTEITSLGVTKTKWFG
jgi:hypothetical protein